MERKYFSDPEAQTRFNTIVDIGKRYLVGTGITDPSIEIGITELCAVEAFHIEASPMNIIKPWRITKEDRPIAKDTSSYSNWELPGGPLEHIRLTSRSAVIITEELQSHAREKGNTQLMHVNPSHAAAGGGLHDEGREVTHLFYTNETVGTNLLKKIGVRSDLISVMPSEKVMLTPESESMDETINSLSIEAVIIRIADEFGKRFPGSRRLYQPEDYDSWDRNKWAESYTNRPTASRPTDDRMRENMPLHVSNVPRYFKALDNWVKSVSTLSLKEVTTILNNELAGRLQLLG